MEWCSGRFFGMRDRAAPYRDHALHSHALRLIALRGGDRNEEAPATENAKEIPVRRAAPLAAHIEPALRTGLMAPVWRLLCVPESNS